MGKTFYEKCYRVTAGFFRGLYRIRVIGAENEPAEGALIAASNHLSNRDVIIVAAALHRQVRFLAKKELFRVPLLGRLITALGAFPVDRGANDVGAIKKTMTLLREGEVVGFYPQGTRCPGVDPRTTKPKNGIGMVVSHTGATVLPISLITKNNRILPFRRCTVVLGEPIPADRFAAEETNRGASYEAIASYVFARICEPFGRVAELTEQTADRS